MDKEFDISGGAKVIREAPVGKGGSSLIGYVITKINGKSMTTASETAKLLDNLTQRGYRIRVEMITPKGEVEQYVFR